MERKTLPAVDLEDNESASDPDVIRRRAVRMLADSLDCAKRGDWVFAVHYGTPAIRAIKALADLQASGWKLDHVIRNYR